MYTQSQIKIDSFKWGIFLGVYFSVTILMNNQTVACQVPHCSNLMSHSLAHVVCECFKNCQLKGSDYTHKWVQHYIWWMCPINITVMLTGHSNSLINKRKPTITILVIHLLYLRILVTARKSLWVLELFTCGISIMVTGGLNVLQAGHLVVYNLLHCVINYILGDKACLQGNQLFIIYSWCIQCCAMLTVHTV